MVLGSTYLCTVIAILMVLNQCCTPELGFQAHFLSSRYKEAPQTKLNSKTCF